MALARDDYHRLVGLLDHFYNLILLDTGTGILDSANQGLLSEADQIVLVVRAGLDGGRAGALTLDWMDEHGFGDLVARAVVVVNAQRHGAAPPERMRRHFEKRCQCVVTVPWDGALEQGALTDMSSLHRKTRDSLVDIAAAVADNFVQMGPAVNRRAPSSARLVAVLLSPASRGASPGAPRRRAAPPRPRRSAQPTDRAAVTATSPSATSGARATSRPTPRRPLDHLRRVLRGEHGPARRLPAGPPGPPRQRRQRLGPALRGVHEHGALGAGRGGRAGPRSVPNNRALSLTPPATPVVRPRWPSRSSLADAATPLTDAALAELRRGSPSRRPSCAPRSRAPPSTDRRPDHGGDPPAGRPRRGADAPATERTSVRPGDRRTRWPPTSAESGGRSLERWRRGRPPTYCPSRQSSRATSGSRDRAVSPTTAAVSSGSATTT